MFLTGWHDCSSSIKDLYQPAAATFSPKPDVEGEGAEHRNHTWFVSPTCAAFQQPSVLVLFIWKVASSPGKLLPSVAGEIHGKLPPVLTDESSGKVVLQDSLQFLLTW